MPRRDANARVKAEIKRKKEAIHQSPMLVEKDVCTNFLAICEASPAVQRACEAFGSDYKNPRDLADLLVVLAAAHFQDKKSGRPKQWDSVRLCSLLSQFLRRRRDNPKATDEKICEEIARGGYPWLKPKSKTQKSEAKTLARLLSDAMDYKKNELLRDFLSNWEETGGKPVKPRRGPPLNWRKIPVREK